MSALVLSKTAANQSLARMRSTLSTWRERAEEQTDNIVGIASTAGGAYALGMADAKWGEDAAFGMSTSLATAIVGHGLALFDVGGKTAANVFRSVGNAGLSVYAYKSGFEMSQRRGG